MVPEHKNDPEGRHVRLSRLLGFVHIGCSK